MSPVEQESDSLSSLEDRIQRAVQLVGRLRQEREAAVEEAAQARREAALLADEVKTLQAERKQVRSRIEKLLGELNDVFSERQVVLARELTKKFEEFLRGKPAELAELTKKRSLKGEFVVMIAPESEAKQTSPDSESPSDPAPA